jgi:hypothetical protein
VFKPVLLRNHWERGLPKSFEKYRNERVPEQIGLFLGASYHAKLEHVQSEKVDPGL